jgi:hypothetical protein
MKLIFGQAPILLITRATRLWAYGYERLILTLFAMPMRLSSLIVFSKISVISFNEYFNVDHYTTKINLVKRTIKSGGGLGSFTQSPTLNKLYKYTFKCTAMTSKTFLDKPGLNVFYSVDHL